MSDVLLERVRPGRLDGELLADLLFRPGPEPLRGRRIHGVCGVPARRWVIGGGPGDLAVLEVDATRVGKLG